MPVDGLLIIGFPSLLFEALHLKRIEFGDYHAHFLI
jgi:hypothetical protein